MGKILGRVVTVAAVVFVGYMLITGQVSIAWEKVIIYIIFIGGISIAAEIRARKQKKQDEAFWGEHQSDAPSFDTTGSLHATDMERTGAADSILHATDAGASGQISDQGVVRAPAIIRGIVTFLLVFIWVMVLCVLMLAAMDGAFEDPENYGAFGILAAMPVLFTVGYFWLANNLFREVYYTPQGVILKRNRSQRQYRWSEIGRCTRYGYLHVFHDLEDKRLFITNSSYEGFDRLYDMYSRTHGSMG